MITVSDVTVYIAALSHYRYGIPYRDNFTIHE